MPRVPHRDLIRAGQLILVRHWLVLVAAWCLVVDSQLSAQELQIVTLAEHLDQPTDLALIPNQAGLLCVESGSGKILRWNGEQLQTLVSGFANTTAADPRWIRFVEERLFVVAGRTAGGKLALFTLTLPHQSTEIDIQSVADEVYPIPLPTDSDASTFLLSAITGNWHRLHYAVQSPEAGATKILQSDIVRGILVETKSFPITPPLASGEHVEALCLSSQLDLVLVIRGVDDQLQLVFADCLLGKRTAAFELGMKDVSAIAYSPRIDRLFAADPESGLYQITVDIDRPNSAKAKLVGAIPGIRAFEFGPDGALYVVVAPESDDGAGQLIQINGLESYPGN